MKNRSLTLSWFVWGIAAFYVLYQFLLQASVSVMVPCLEPAFHIGTAGIGLLSSSFFYTYLIMQIPAGMLTDHFGPRRVLSFSVIIVAIACFIFSFSHALSLAEASRMLMGLATAPAVVCAFTLAGRWFPAKRFALLVGLTEMLGMLGGAIGEVFIAHCVAGPLGWRGSFILCGVIGVVLAILVWMFVRDQPEGAKKEVPPVKTAGLSRQMFSVLTTGQIWVIGLYSGLSFAVLAAFASLWSVPFLKHVYAFGLQKAAFASALIFLGAAIGGPFFGWFSNHIGRRCLPMYIGSFISIVCGALLFYFKLPVNFLFLTLFCLGFFSASYVISFALVGDLVKSEVKGTALGFTNMMCILIGAPILQPVMGVLIHWTHGRYDVALLPLFVCLILGFVSVFFIKETYAKPLSSLVAIRMTSKNEE